MADLLTGETLVPPAAIWVKAQILLGPQPSLLLGPPLWHPQRIHKTIRSHSQLSSFSSTLIEYLLWTQKGRGEAA